MVQSVCSQVCRLVALFDVFASEVDFISLLEGWSLHPSFISVSCQASLDELEICLEFLMQLFKLFGRFRGCRGILCFPGFTVYRRRVTIVGMHRCFLRGLP